VPYGDADRLMVPPTTSLAGDTLRSAPSIAVGVPPRAACKDGSGRSSTGVPSIRGPDPTLFD
jgi:hypothetical protein